MLSLFTSKEDMIRQLTRQGAGEVWCTGQLGGRVSTDTGITGQYVVLQDGSVTAELRRPAYCLGARSNARVVDINSLRDELIAG
jgi:hypothetical protein